VNAVKGTSVDIERFTPATNQVMTPSQAIAKTNADAVMVAEGGQILRAVAPSLGFAGLDKNSVKLLGTGLWDDDRALAREAALEGSWYAAPAPNADAEFVNKYRTTYGAAPAQLASLAYDAISLVALLAQGPAYHRYTAAALNDPNGFSGVNGIFRFQPDGTSERGLAVLEMTSAGPVVISPAPTTFQKPGA